MQYKLTELAMGVALLVAALFAWLNLRDLPDDARMFPNMIILVLAVATTIMILRSLSGASQRAQGDDLKNWQFSINPGRMIGGFLLFSGYLLVVEWLGYFTASALFVIVCAAFAKYRNWPVLVAASVAFCIFVYAVFGVLFNRPLPKEFFQSKAALELTTGDYSHA